MLFIDLLMNLSYEVFIIYCFIVLVRKLIMFRELIFIWVTLIVFVLFWIRDKDQCINVNGHPSCFSHVAVNKGKLCCACRLEMLSGCIIITALKRRITSGHHDRWHWQSVRDGSDADNNTLSFCVCVSLCLGCCYWHDDV